MQACKIILYDDACTLRGVGLIAAIIAVKVESKYGRDDKSACGFDADTKMSNPWAVSHCTSTIVDVCWHSARYCERLCHLSGIITTYVY